MTNYEKKYERLYNLQDGFCPISGNVLSDCVKVDMHHNLPRTKTNAALYPKLIDSLWNLELVDHDAHMTKSKPHISFLEANNRETFLVRHPLICAALNMEQLPHNPFPAETIAEPQPNWTLIEGVAYDLSEPTRQAVFQEMCKALLVLKNQLRRLEKERL